MDMVHFYIESTLADRWIDKRVTEQAHDEKSVDQLKQRPEETRGSGRERRIDQVLHQPIGVRAANWISQMLRALLNGDVQRMHHVVFQMVDIERRRNE